MELSRDRICIRDHFMIILTGRRYGGQLCAKKTRGLLLLDGVGLLTGKREKERDIIYGRNNIGN